MFYKKLMCFLLLPFLFLCSGLQAIHGQLQPLIDALIEIAETHRQDRSKPVPLIAIGGCPGVGKTYLTNSLLEQLQERGICCKVLPLDHFNLSPEERKNIGTEWDIRHFKVQQLHECLASIFSGEKSIQKPVCNQLTGELSTELMVLNDTDVLLFDGLYALCSKSAVNFFEYCSLGIFLEAEEADIYAWKWEREQKKKQPRTPEQFARHMKALLLEYYQNIEYSRKEARFIIRKDSNHAYSLVETRTYKIPPLKAA